VRQKEAAVLAFVLTTLLGAAAPANDVPVDAPLPGAAVPLEEKGRYKITRSYEETLDFYRRLFNQTGGVRWRNVVTLPSIKAKHIESLRKKTRWEGINIYEKQGEVRVFVIPREASDRGAKVGT
jgi:hypothetical protein